MKTLYTAIGRFERRTDKKGYKYPVIIINGQEFHMSIPEMLIWTCLNWHIADLHQIQLLYNNKAEQINNMSYDYKEAYVEGLVHRGLIVCGMGENDNDALYDLLNGLNVIPVLSSFFVKITAFLKFVVFDKVPISRAKEVLKREQFSTDEKRVINLVKQAQLSVAEIIKCVEIDIYDISSEYKIMEALYNDADTTSDNIGYYAKFYGKQQYVLNIISILYLRRLIYFERI